MIRAGEQVEQMRDAFPHPLLAELVVRRQGKEAGEVGLLYDALYDKRCSAALLDAMA
jgi:hypothetical protein